MKRSSIAVIGLFLLIYIALLGVRPIMIPDESRYAEIPREMIAGDNWVVPCLNGLRYFEKPVLGYWLNAGSMILFGENAFAVRFPSAVAAGVSALMVFFLVRRFAGGYSAGLVAAVIFLTCLLVFGVSTFNVLDGLFSLFITGIMVAFLFAHRAERPIRKMAFLVLSGIFCGLAFLTKGFIAFVGPLVAIVPFMVWERRWKDLFRFSWIPVLTALLISLPWALMIHLREPDFWDFFIWNEHIKRFMADSAQHQEPFWYYVLWLPGAALPWTPLFPAAVLGLKKSGLKSPLLRFSLCWILFPFLFFSVSKGKLLTYILPCFPPLAILIGAGLHSYFKEGGRRLFRVGATILLPVMVTLAAALPVVQMTGFHDIKPYTQTWKWGLAIMACLSWALFLLFSIRESRHQRKIMLYAAAPLLFMGIIPFVIPDLTAERKAPGEFLLRHSHRIYPNAILVSDEDPVSAVCWFYRRNDIYLLGDPGELSYGLRYDESKHRLLNFDQFSELVQKSQRTAPVILFTKVKKYQDWKQHLPKPCFEDSNGNGGFIFAQF